jgi:hypothetical protein
LDSTRFWAQLARGIATRGGPAAPSAAAAGSTAFEEAAATARRTGFRAYELLALRGWRAAADGPGRADSRWAVVVGQMVSSDGEWAELVDTLVYDDSIHSY